MVSSPFHVEKAPKLLRLKGQYMGFCHFTHEQAEARVPHPRLQDSQENKYILTTGQVADDSQCCCGLRSGAGTASAWLGDGRGQTSGV